MNLGKLYLIPSPLGENDPAEVIPAPVLKSLEGFRTFVVEEVRTARRYLSKAGLKGKIGELQFFELNEHTDQATIEGYLKLFAEGNDVALISEAGLPAVADPGAQLVALAHRHGIEVVPAVGPSSLMLALMASGLNGQSFAFCGYIPAKTEERKSRLRTLEKVSGQLKQTQILIETPYRNDSLFNDILSVCAASTRVCVAANITMPDAYIKTKKVSEWKKEGLTIGKRPCVFLLDEKNEGYITGIYYTKGGEDSRHFVYHPNGYWREIRPMLHGVVKKAFVLDSKGVKLWDNIMTGIDETIDIYGYRGRK